MMDVLSLTLLMDKGVHEMKKIGKILIGLTLAVSLIFLLHRQGQSMLRVKSHPKLKRRSKADRGWKISMPVR